MGKIYIDCEDKAGEEIYYKVIQTALLDVVIGKSLNKVVMICREKDPYFIIGVLPKSTSRPVKLRDVVSVEESKKEGGKTITKLRIVDETYAPQVLEKLNVIDQPSRFEIITDTPIDLDMVIYDAEGEFIAKVLDFMNRVFPEGMRIRKAFYGKSIVMIASERPFEEEWIKRALELKEELESG